MVEGGLLTSLDFLEEIIIDMVIIIQSPFTFRKALGLGIYDEILEKDGLTKLEVRIYGNDTVHYWMRNERYLSHIMVEVGPSDVLAFLEKRIIYMAIIIRLPVTFRKPLGLGISDGTLEKAGLTKLGVEICRDDIVHY